jgi:hypothetical protein
MKTPKDIMEQAVIGRLSNLNLVNSQSMGYNGHIYLEDGDTDNIHEFTSFQVIGNMADSDFVTVTYSTVSPTGAVETHTAIDLFPGDTVLGTYIKNISITAGTGKIRAYKK